MIELRTAWRSALLLSLLLLPAGCNYFAAVAALTPVYKDPVYKGFVNQSVGVMVWADRGVDPEQAASSADGQGEGI